MGIFDLNCFKKHRRIDNQMWVSWPLFLGLTISSVLSVATAHADEVVQQNSTVGQAYKLEDSPEAAQSQFYLSITNTSGADLDVIRFVNGSPQILGILANGAEASILTSVGDHLHFGADGQLLSDHMVTVGQSARLEIGTAIFGARLSEPQAKPLPTETPSEAADISPTQIFQCANGTRLEVQLDNRAVETIAIIKADDVTANLIQVISGSGSRYSNGDFEFHVKAGDAVYRRYDDTTNCTAG